MRPVFKYIFCGLVLAALVFISLCVFYIANTYAISTKNKAKPIFPNYSASYLANVTTAEIREIEDMPPVYPSDGEADSGISDGSFPHFEPSETTPEIEPESEPVEESLPLGGETEPEFTIPDEEASNYTSLDESHIDFKHDEPLEDHEISEIDGLEESGEILEPSAYSDDHYTEIDLLYSILETMKLNQHIALFVLAVSLIIIVFKPIDKSFF